MKATLNEDYLKNIIKEAVREVIRRKKINFSLILYTLFRMKK